MPITSERLQNLAGGFQAAKILLTANELGIFKEIGEGEKTVDEIARALRLNREGTERLVGALVGLGLLRHKTGKFSNALDVKKYLVRESEDSMASIFNHMNHMYESWAGLDEIVKKGRPKRAGKPKILYDKKRNRDFIRGMFEIGQRTAGMLADQLDFKGVRKMADIGGGPAVYPIAISKKRPDIGFVLADYPNTINVAREYVRKYGVEKKIKLVRCEFFDVDELGIGEDFDLALLSQVLHAASDEKARALILKTYRCLRPGGRIIINENALDNDKLGPTLPLIFAINMLVQNAGRTFSAGELADWLREAGFKSIKTRRLHERSVLVEGRK